MIEIVTDEMLLRSLLSVEKDRHEPDYACYIVRAIQSLDDESAVVTITLAIDAACWSTKRPNRRQQPFCKFKF